MQIHFIAIGGSVMHQLAISLKKKGYQVTGSDDEIFEPARTNLINEQLLPPELGWFPEKIQQNLDAVILGMHAQGGNPELQRAMGLGLKIYSFPEYIFEESRQKKRIVIGGSHGKTTTTAMIMHVLRACGRKFDYLVGARLSGFSQSVKISDAPVIICEGDEYPASAIEKRPKFHFLYPHIAVLTGIAWDHINVFPSFTGYVEQFKIFINKIQKNGVLIYNQSDPVLAGLVSEIEQELRIIPYHIPEHRIVNGTTTVEIEGRKAHLSIFGDHNLMNLQAAWRVCEELAIDPGSFLEAIRSFAGAAKRLELLASNHQTCIYRDFAHAPSKVKATIEAVKRQFPDRRLIGVLELHTYSSLNEAFMVQYKGAMENADSAVVFYSSHALSLKKLPDLPAESIRRGFNKQGLIIINEKSELMDWLNQQSYENANLVLMSSGDFDGADMITFAQKIVA